MREVTDKLPRSHVDGPAYLTSMATLNFNLGSLPLQPGNHVDLITGYREAIVAMTDALKTATTSIEVEFYICRLGRRHAPFFEELLAATARGVKVRLLMDHMGSRSIPEYKGFVAKLDASDIDWRHDDDGAPAEGPVPAAGPAQPPQDPRRRRPGGVRRLAEPDRARLQQGEEPQGQPRVRRAGRPLRGADGPRPARRLRQGLVHRGPGAHRGRRPGQLRRAPRRRGRAGAPQRARLRHGEQPAALLRPDLLRPEEPVDHQPLLRAGRAAAVRRHHGRAARGRGRAVRERVG